MTKVSPIARFLTANNVIPKRNGNVWHFYNKEGLCIGAQFKTQINGISSYVRQIFGEGFKTLFQEHKFIAQKCTYFVDKESPVGLNIAITDSFVLSHLIDYTSNISKYSQKTKSMINQRKLIAIEENTKAGIFHIDKPFMYREQKIDSKNYTLTPKEKIKHTVH